MTPNVLFLDMMFKKARKGDEAGDQYLADALSDDPRAVLAGVLFRNEANRLESPKLFPAADYDKLLANYQIGLIHNVLDSDGMTRSGFITAEETASHGHSEADLRQIFPSAALALLLKKADPITVGEGTVRAGNRSLNVRVDSKERTAVGVRLGPPATASGVKPSERAYPIVSFNRLMDPDDPIFDELDGKYIMVGQIVTSEPYGEIDRVQTIVGDIKGVEVHARILDSLLNENYFVQMGPVARYASVVTTVLLTLAILSLYREPKSYLVRLAGLVVILGIIYTCALLLFSYRMELLILWFAVAAVSAAVLFGRFMLTFKALTRVVPKEVAKELLLHHDAKDRRQTATILLTDIRGYTTLSEGRTAVAMLDVLNEYHKRTVACYDRYGGQALTYQGDAQIVVFGVFGNRKNPAADAVAAALGLQSICDDLREEWGIESRDDFDVGAGLCTGEVEVGMLGGSRNRQYSVVGETVRKAHKVQSLSADLEAPVILDEETFEACGDSVKVEDLGMVQPKGLPAKIRLYRGVSVE